jgi:tetratricopeptide (TPR) repeat protein
LFGGADTRGLLETNVGYVVQRAALNQWSKQEIKPAELYALFGWELPPYTVRNSQGLEFFARQVKLSLLLYGSKITGIFGPIEQDRLFASPDTLVATAIEHPDVYYVNLGNEYRRQRNFGLAEDAFRQAVAYNESNASAHDGLGRTLADEGRCVEAQEQLDAATQLDPGFRDPFAGILTCR